MIKMYAEFQQGQETNHPYPEREVPSSCEPHEVPIPTGYVAVRFFKRKITSYPGGEHRGAKFGVSGWYYQGTRQPIAQVKGEDYLRLAKLGCREVVVTNHGTFPLYAVDNIL